MPEPRAMTSTNVQHLMISGPHWHTIKVNRNPPTHIYSTSSWKHGRGGSCACLFLAKAELRPPTAGSIHRHKKHHYPPCCFSPLGVASLYPPGQFGCQVNSESVSCREETQSVVMTHRGSSFESSWDGGPSRIFSLRTFAKPFRRQDGFPACSAWLEMSIDRNKNNQRSPCSLRRQLGKKYFCQLREAESHGKNCVSFFLP